MTPPDPDHPAAIIGPVPKPCCEMLPFGYHVSSCPSIPKLSKVEEAIDYYDKYMEVRNESSKVRQALHTALGEDDDDEHTTLSMVEHLAEYKGTVEHPELNIEETGLAHVARWVRECKAALDKDQSGIFDSGLRCVSEGGEIFFIDPEEIEETMDALGAVHGLLERMGCLNPEHPVRSCMDLPMPEIDRCFRCRALLVLKERFASNV